MNRKLPITLIVLLTSSVLVLDLFAASPAMLPVADVVTAQSSHGFTAPAPAQADAAQVAHEPTFAARVEAVALPIDPRADSDELVVTTTLTTEAAAMATLARTLEHTAAPPAVVQKPRHHSGKSSRIRQSMAMPFFSFAPRG